VAQSLTVLDRPREAESEDNDEDDAEKQCASNEQCSTTARRHQINVSCGWCRQNDVIVRDHVTSRCDQQSCTWRNGRTDRRYKQPRANCLLMDHSHHRVARVDSDTWKYDRGLMTIVHDELHWLIVYERIEYKLGVMVYRCLHDWAPLYTSLITSSQFLMLLLAVFIYDPLTGIVSLFLAADLARAAVGLFITLTRQSGTRCQMNLEIRAVLIHTYIHKILIK